MPTTSQPCEVPRYIVSYQRVAPLLMSLYILAVKMGHPIRYEPGAATKCQETVNGAGLGACTYRARHYATSSVPVTGFSARLIK